MPSLVQTLTTITVNYNKLRTITTESQTITKNLQTITTNYGQFQQNHRQLQKTYRQLQQITDKGVPLKDAIFGGYDVV